MDFPDQRQAAILERLAADGRVLAGALAREFGTSEDTIRRDLRDLAAAGRCRRVYGGALPVSPASGSLRQRMGEEQDSKRRLGRAAAAIVGADPTIGCILIDAGSTNLCIARALSADRPLTVITNAPAVAAELAGRPGIDLVMIGGRIDPRSGGSYGPKACAEAAEIFPDLAFIGSCAVGPAGLAAFDADEAVFKRQLVRNAGRAVTAVANSRLGTGAPLAFATLDSLDHIVVEADAPDETLAALGLGPERVIRAGAKD